MAFVNYGLICQSKKLKLTLEFKWQKLGNRQRVLEWQGVFPGTCLVRLSTKCSSRVSIEYSSRVSTSTVESKYSVH